MKTTSGVRTLPRTTAFPPPTTQSLVSSLTTILDISQLDMLDLAECSRSRCNGNGQCVQSGCECGWAYSGISCQDHLLQVLQGPKMYGAVGVCAGVLLLIVVVVVVLKKRTSSRLVVMLKPASNV